MRRRALNRRPHPLAIHGGTLFDINRSPMRRPGFGATTLSRREREECAAELTFRPFGVKRADHEQNSADQNDRLIRSAPRSPRGGEHLRQLGYLFKTVKNPDFRPVSRDFLNTVDSATQAEQRKNAHGGVSNHRQVFGTGVRGMFLTGLFFRSDS